MPLTLGMHANGETVGVHRGATIELVRLVPRRYEPPALSLGYLRPWLPRQIARRFRVTIRVT